MLTVLKGYKMNYLLITYLCISGTCVDLKAYFDTKRQCELNQQETLKEIRLIGHIEEYSVQCLYNNKKRKGNNEKGQKKT